MEELTEEYQKLLMGIGRLAEFRLESLQDRVGVQDLAEAFEVTLADLRSHSAVDEFGRAFRELDARVARVFLLELKYVTANLPNEADDLLAWDNNRVKKAFEDAKIGKDSLEDLLDRVLPEWVKNLLKVLNELISLAL